MQHLLRLIVFLNIGSFIGISCILAYRLILAPDYIDKKKVTVAEVEKEKLTENYRIQFFTRSKESHFR